jgi:hypothetical protein
MSKLRPPEVTQLWLVELGPLALADLLAESVNPIGVIRQRCLTAWNLRTLT